ncbi:MAG TPA: GTP-sensing pleiotropic transcriptional regulator CodY [Firmicutes bacterium]|nr:GTP-sensing pleiotropic transcriptional regulator CodY [Bacillota bacterium]
MVLKRLKQYFDLLQNEGSDVEYEDLLSALKEAAVENTNVYLIDKNGKIAAYAADTEFSASEFDEEWIVNQRIPDDLNNSLLKIGAVTVYDGHEKANMLVAPIVGGSRRIGSLLFAGEKSKFNEDDFIIAEFAATTIGMVIANRIDIMQEDEAQEIKLARSAIKSLSYSEILAMQHIFDELDGNEGLLVASRIADNAGITRSVIVNALRKLASAGVVESRSLGMKGTYLRILNKEIRNEFERQRYPYPKKDL